MHTQNARVVPTHAPTPHAPKAPVALPTTFSELALCEQLQSALELKAYSEPSPIQAQAIPHLLEGRDLIGCAQTGTGKTAAFALPILQRLALNPKPHNARRPRVLVLAPTRELAAQIAQSFAAYGRNMKLTQTVVFGGVGSNPQIRALARGVDILVATPGRLADLESQKHVYLDAVEVFVLDEADRMLDQGFIHEIKRIIKKLPAQRQSLLFSATMPQAIEDLATSIVHNPVRVSVAPESTTAERIDQKVCFVESGDKLKLLAHTITQHAEGLVLVFVRMKHLANRVAEQLERSGIPADAIHGNKSQGARTRALENFRSGRKRVMVATDIAARGIDVKGISLVINFNLPEEPEAYVHRIGRTARAGKDGCAVSFCDRSERSLLRAIERTIRQPIPVHRNQPFHPTTNTPEAHDSQMDNRSSAPREERGFRPHRGQSGGGRPQADRPRHDRPARQDRPHNARPQGERPRFESAPAAPRPAGSDWKPSESPRPQVGGFNRAGLPSRGPRQSQNRRRFGGGSGGRPGGFRGGR